MLAENKRLLILAAGRGSRLGTLTEKCPKCMVEIDGQSILSRLLDSCSKLGLQDIFIVTGYKKDSFIGLNIEQIYNPYWSSTNMVASLDCALDLISNEKDTLVCYSDIIFESHILKTMINLTSNLTVASNTKWLDLWSQRMENPLNDVETFIHNSERKLLEIGKKTSSVESIMGQFMGLVQIPKDHASDLKEHLRNFKIQVPNWEKAYFTDFLQFIIDNGGHIQVEPFDGGWLEIDTTEDLSIYQKLLKSNQLDRFCQLNGDD